VTTLELGQESKLADPKQLAILQQGVEAWNLWRQQDERTQLDLTGADLRQADLSGADLTGAKVTDAQLAQLRSLTGATMPDGTVHEVQLGTGRRSGMRPG
jgi:uncharacterized protein YjbI with pentapeptide repeats